MPNILNRKKKKNKVQEVVVDDKSDSSDSSCSYDFSSKLNCKYNVFPEEMKRIVKNVKTDKDESKALRWDDSPPPIKNNYII